MSHADTIRAPLRMSADFGPIFGDVKIMPDGRIAYVCPILFGRAQIAIGSRQFVGDRYTYEDPLAAVMALDEFWQRATRAGWVSEPLGWIRHQPSDRRRPGGDIEREYVGR